MKGPVLHTWILSAAWARRLFPRVFPICRRCQQPHRTRNGHPTPGREAREWKADTVAGRQRSGKPRVRKNALLWKIISMISN